MATQTYSVQPITTTDSNSTMCNGTASNISLCDSNFTMTTPRFSFFGEYAPIVQNLWLYLGFIILFIGTIGHTLTFAVIASSRYLRQLSSSVYLVAMSIAGILALYTGLLRYVIFIGISNYEVDLRESSEAICKFHMSSTYFSLQYFAWIQATISVDRLICVLKPHRYRLSCKWMAAMIISIVEFILVLGVNSIVIKEATLNPYGYCVFGDHKFYLNTWVYIDLMSFSLIPATIMVICNTVILIVLRQLKSRLGGSSSDSMSRSLTMMLMTLNLIFLITTLPISVIGFLDWGQYGTQKYATMEVCWTCFSLLQYVGAASTFLIYCFTGPQFREEMWTLFRCTKQCQKKVMSQTSKSQTKLRKNSATEQSNTQLTVFRSTSNSMRYKNGHELRSPNNNMLPPGSVNGYCNRVNGSVQEYSSGPDLESSPSQEKLIQVKSEMPEVD